MERIVIFGGTGFIGLSLARHLEARGLHPVLVARNRPRRPLPYEFVTWDAVTVGDWMQVLDHAQAVVNLAGKTVDCIKSLFGGSHFGCKTQLLEPPCGIFPARSAAMSRKNPFGRTQNLSFLLQKHYLQTSSKTPDNCDLILRSRVDSTKAIGKALTQVENPPKIWIQMSTAHIYGDPPLQWCSEDSTTGYGLAPFVGKAWEEAFLNAIPADVRGVRLRTSFVVGRNGGALASLKKIVSLGLGGTVGNGKQGFSWIHEYDLNELIFQAIRHERFRGIYIASAPNPVSNKEFMRTLRKKMRVPIGLPAPEWITRIGAKFLFKTDPELALYGRYVKSARLEKEGFTFKYPTLEEALDDLI